MRPPELAGCDARTSLVSEALRHFRRLQFCPPNWVSHHGFRETGAQVYRIFRANPQPFGHLCTTKILRATKPQSPRPLEFVLADSGKEHSFYLGWKSVPKILYIEVSAFLGIVVLWGRKQSKPFRGGGEHQRLELK